jgi:hypothetical protein
MELENNNTKGIEICPLIQGLQNITIYETIHVSNQINFDDALGKFFIFI